MEVAPESDLDALVMVMVISFSSQTRIGVPVASLHGRRTCLQPSGRQHFIAERLRAKISLICPLLNSSLFLVIRLNNSQVSACNSASNFLSVFNAQALKKSLLTWRSLFDYPSETFPSFSADLTDANPRGWCSGVLEGQAEALGVPVGTISISMASDLSVENSGSLSYEALTRLWTRLLAPSIEDITFADTADKSVKQIISMSVVRLKASRPIA